MKYGQKILHRLTSEQGVSLLEIFIAISIFSVGVLAVAEMQVMAIRVNRTSSMHTSALTVAQDQMELLVGVPYVVLDNYIKETTSEVNGITYTTTVAGGAVTGVPGNRVRPVTVQVQYDDVGKTRTVLLSTYMAEADE